jgi:hypothetical protein
MKKLFLLFTIVCFLTSCNVTESIVFNENGSGQFLVTYEMGQAMKAVTETIGGGASDNEKKEKGKVIDTTMVFADVMETYRDSVAALPEDKRLAMEMVKDMFMNMKVDEDEGIMDMGIGLNFNSIDALKDINKKIKKAQSLNTQGDQVGAMIEKSPLGNFFGNENNAVGYSLSENSFSRETIIELPEDAAEDAVDELFDEADESNQEFMDYFESAYYNVKLTFPKAVKSISVDGVEFSKDKKTVTYKVNWIEYLKNPNLLDVNVEF